MTTIHARQIQLTKMRIRKTKKVLYIISNIFSPPYFTHVFTPLLLFSPLSTHIYPSHYTPLSPLPYAALHYNSLHFTSLHFPSLHFTSLHFFYTFRWFSLHFTSLHFLSLHFSMIFRTIYFSLCNTHSISTTTVVAPTRLNITLHVHCLSGSIFKVL